MKKFILSSEEKEQLEYLHKKTKDVRESDCIRAIFFRSEGWSISMIALALRKHVDSVSRFIDDCFIRNKLKPQNDGSESHLNTKQSKDLIIHLEKNIYLTSNAIREYILDKYGVHYIHLLLEDACFQSLVKRFNSRQNTAGMQVAF